MWIWSMVACTELTCGEGTVRSGKECIPEVVLFCGQGTTFTDGSCQGADLACGPGTINTGGVCSPDSDALDSATNLFLPFPHGQAVRVTQGNQSGFSHNGSQAWAVDFEAEVGTPIASVRAGLVVGVKEDSNSNCPDSSCAADANYIRVDHGDGSITQFLHLELDGADVEVGDQVAKGETIGRTGNTGWSTGPHLHFDLFATDGFTRPIRFVEFASGVGDGTPYSGTNGVSENTLEGRPSNLAPSTCAADAFHYRGVDLISEIPCSRAEIGVDYPLEAELAPGFDLAIDRFSRVQGEWLRQCHTPVDGRVSTTLRFGAQNFEESAYLMLSAAAEGQDCDFVWSWVGSPLIILE